MSHSPIGKAFLERIAEIPEGPGAILDDVLKVSLDEEQELRKLFAQEKDHKTLNDPYVGLVDVFGEGTDCIRKTRARVVKSTLDTVTNVEVQDQNDLKGKYVMPLKEEQRRKEGELCMVADLEEFKKNWSVFTEGNLSQLFGGREDGKGPWENVVAAGGSVLSALLPLGKEHKKSKRAIRKWYHSKAYPTSDVDLFLWGLTPEQAEKKIVQIYEAVRDSVPWDVTCIRTKHTISIHSQYPYRSVQIVLRLYKSPAEIVAGFDIDAPCCAYDGERVWANPRAIIAMMRQANTVDVTRRSPSYEVRLAKYSRRGFEVYVPNLRRADIDPTIYERSIVKIEGLARLLVLERILNVNARYQFLDARRNLRGRPFALRRPEERRKRTYKGDLKADVGDLLEMNDYDVASLHIPYGPGWDSRKVQKLVYQTDLGMNSTFNPKNKGRRLHRHPAFFGTVEECMEDCCENCPEPIDDDERALQAQEEEKYIRGRISFIEENPGRQSLSGSFHPIDEGEWSDQVYVRPIDKLFEAIAAHDRPLVQQILKEQEGTLDLKHRDHVGRTTLHVAILCKDEEIAWDLIEAGCRMIGRLAEGRTALHLAAQYGLNDLIERMLKRSEENKEAAKKKDETKDDDENMEIEGPPDTTTDTDTGRPSSANDWSSDDNDGKVIADVDDSMDVDDDEGGNEDEESGSDDYDQCEDDDDDESEGKSRKGTEKKAQVAPDGEVPEDEEDEPDVLDIDAGDWDHGLTPLCYAILYATRRTVDILLKAGADVNKPAVSLVGVVHYQRNSFHPLFFTLVRPDEDIAVEIADRLLEADVTSSIASDKQGGLLTIFHQTILAGRSKILDLFLRKDPGAKAVVDIPLMSQGNSTFPIVSAIMRKNHSAILTLLAHGCKINPESEDVIRAKTSSANTNGWMWGFGETDYSKIMYRPVETALTGGDNIVNTLVEVGADINVGVLNGLTQHAGKSEQKTILDWVKYALESLDKSIKDAQEKLDELEKVTGKKSFADTPAKFKTWKEYIINYSDKMTIIKQNREAEGIEKKRKDQKEVIAQYERKKVFLARVNDVLELKGAKSWEEVYGKKNVHENQRYNYGNNDDDTSKPKPRYQYVGSSWRSEYPQAEQNGQYEELFEAAFRGDNAKIEKLCVPSPDASKNNKPEIPIRITVVDIFDKDEPLHGLTPLYAAIANKHWSTAKLIMGIAAAQYRDDDDEEEQDRVRARLFDLVEASDSDDGDSDCSDDTIDAHQRQTKFIDIAKNIKVVTDVHPSILLSRTLSYPVSHKKTSHNTLLDKSIRENDFETFTHLFSLHKNCQKGTSQSSAVDNQVMAEILLKDNPKFFDELIRRTGHGIDVDTVRKTAGDDTPIVLNDQNRLYLGLNIRGKKRTDLARKGDPNNYSDYIAHIPIVWKVIRAGAKSIVEYLASEKPLAAYKHFAMNGSGSRAEWLRHSKNVDKKLSEWLGWFVSPLGESPLTAAVLGGRADMLSFLFAKAPQIMGSATHQKIKFLGYNALLTAAVASRDKHIFEILLKRGVSAVECDRTKKWNIYHWLCANNNGNVIEFLLETLPREVNEELLAQKSKEKLDTPLQIALKKSHIRPVKLIIEYTQQGLLEYDAHGFTPLQNAVRLGYRQILEALIEKTPEEGLFLENGVGKTPFEDAEKRALKPTTDSVDTSGCSQKLQVGSSDNINIGDDSSEMEERLEKLIETFKRLTSNGTIKKEEKLAEMFERFISSTEGRLAKFKAEESLKREEEDKDKDKDHEYNDHLDYEDRLGTYTSMAKAVEGKEGGRKLIHLKDVQMSVETDLKIVNKGRVVVDDGEGLEEEEDDESKEKAQGMVYNLYPIVITK